MGASGDTELPETVTELQRLNVKDTSTHSRSVTQQTTWALVLLLREHTESETNQPPIIL
jgi:hypothetical protein